MSFSRAPNYAGGGIVPSSNYGPDAAGSAGTFDMPDIGSHLGQLFSGLFGHSDRPFKEAMNQYGQTTGKVEATQNPFLKFGQEGIPLFQKWLSGMQDPSGFINNLMGNYNESPYAKFQQEQAMRAAQNMGSTGESPYGGAGSTPLTQFAQQNARDISSQDMNQWLQNVLGINTQYGAGLGHQIGVGQGSANNLTNFYNDMGSKMAEASFGRERQKQIDQANKWGGIFNLAGDAAKFAMM